MHSSYAPDEIDEDYIENTCDDLKIAMINILENGGDEEECNKAQSLLRLLERIIYRLRRVTAPGKERD